MESLKWTHCRRLSGLWAPESLAHAILPTSSQARQPAATNVTTPGYNLHNSEHASKGGLTNRCDFLQPNSSGTLQRHRPQQAADRLDGVVPPRMQMQWCMHGDKKKKSEPPHWHTGMHTATLLLLSSCSWCSMHGVVNSYDRNFAWEVENGILEFREFELWLNGVRVHEFRNSGIPIPYFIPWNIMEYFEIHWIELRLNSE